MIERTFQNIPESKLSEADQQSFLVSLGWLGGTTWEDLLRSLRVLIISEAGAGKTYECREQAHRVNGGVIMRQIGGVKMHHGLGGSLSA